MKDHFKVKSIINLDEVKLGDVIPTSDFGSITPKGSFVQLEYFEEDVKKREPYNVHPGFYTIKKTMSGMKLEETHYVTDDILASFAPTKGIVDRVQCFIRNKHKYAQYKIEVPRRSMLLYGPQGSGKSSSLIELSRIFNKDTKTCIVTWPTDVLEAYEVKSFVKRFNYVDCDLFMLFIEDIGGVEIDQTRMKSDSSLLSFLDNKEKCFKIPTFIVATTNFPENFLGNLTNRPGRFDDKIEVGFPNAEQRYELVKFFSKGTLNEQEMRNIGSEKYKEFTPSHIQECFLRKDIYEMTWEQALNSIRQDIETYNSGFSKRKKVGIE